MDNMVPSFPTMLGQPATTAQPTMELCVVGRKKWNQLPERVFTYAPLELLTAYCQSYATWQYYESMFMENPRLRVSEKFNMEGEIIGEMISPEAKLASEALKQMQSLAKQLDL